MPTPLLARAPHDAEDLWDAIRVPRRLGLAAMSSPGIRVGAVVEDSARSALVAALEDVSGPRPGEEAAR